MYTACVQCARCTHSELGTPRLLRFTLAVYHSPLTGIPHSCYGEFYTVNDSLWRDTDPFVSHSHTKSPGTHKDHTYSSRISELIHRFIKILPGLDKLGFTTLAEQSD